MAQLAGYISEHAAYHHGEASLNATVINMAQNYTGSNNLQLLFPSGQFGTRLQVCPLSLFISRLSLLSLSPSLNLNVSNVLRVCVCVCVRVCISIYPGRQGRSKPAIHLHPPRGHRT